MYMPETTVSEEREATDKDIYSNFDHSLNEEVEAVLKANERLFAQHSAWNFCGYVYYANGTWYDEVWRYNIPYETISGDTAFEVIQSTNAEFGSD